jgi:membrane protease YdiL (CAAX protease family)
MKTFFLILTVLGILLFAAVLSCDALGLGLCAPLGGYASTVASGAVHLVLFSLALFFLWKRDAAGTMKALGFPGRLKDGLFYGFMTLSAIFLVLFCLGAAAILLGFNDQQKVQQKIDSLPILVLAFAVAGAPITEELFFRGFLTGRAGVVLSSVVFGLMHFAYGSVVEVLGAFMIGLVLAMSFKLTKSITPCIIAHMAYNAISITVMRLLM